VTLANPAWLILLVLLPLLGVGAVAVARMRRKKWAAFVAPRLRQNLLKRGSPLPRWFALVFLLAACAALIAALSRPRAEAGTRTEKTIGRNLLVALDLSRSMRVRDVKPDRLAQAKMVIYELIEAMPNERIGLIGFAGNAYLYAPLTVDHAAVRETVDQIDETWAPLGGSNLSEALKLAIETFKGTGQKNNALVIISDGEKHERDITDMIAEAERAGVYILAVGVGTEDGGYIPNADGRSGNVTDNIGQVVLSRLQPDVMRQLAEETKGRFAMAGSGTDIPAIVKSTIKDLDSFEMEGRERRIAVEFYQWLLLPAIFMLIASIVAGTRWRGVKPAAVIAGLALMPGTVRADAAGDARKSLERKNHPEAREAYRKLAEETRLPDRKARFHLGEATAAYRGQDFKHARSAYSNAMLSDDADVRASGHLGMGNTLFQLGWRLLTGETYPNDPEELPDMDFFDTKVGELLDKLIENPEGDADTGGYQRLESIITNWSDAVRHFDSGLAHRPEDKPTRNNRDMTVAYLKRLQELLEDEKQSAEEAMPQPQQQGEGQPQPNEGEGDQEGEPKDGEGKEPRPDGEKGEGDEQENKDGSGDQDKPNDRDGKGNKKEEQDKDSKGPKDPDETPEERARRILQENADLEKGPLSPGRREFRPPEKDW
jgi:Ca-activated chloride channel homolog